MRHDTGAARKAVNLSLPVDLVARARACTGNLSGTVEDLLTEFVVREEARRSADDQRTERLIDALNGLVAEHGTFGDDLSQL